MTCPFPRASLLRGPLPPSVVACPARWSSSSASTSKPLPARWSRHRRTATHSRPQRLTWNHRITWRPLHTPQPWLDRQSTWEAPNVQAALHGASQYLDWLDGDYAWARSDGANNEDHLAYLESYVEGAPGGSGESGVAADVDETAKHRDEVLAALARMRASLVDG